MPNNPFNLTPELLDAMRRQQQVYETERARREQRALEQRVLGRPATAPAQAPQAQAQIAYLWRDATGATLSTTFGWAPPPGAVQAQIVSQNTEVATATLPPETPSKVMEDAKERFANTFQLGCDPEFVALDAKGQLVNVTGLMRDPRGPVGFDHNGRVVELRPAPSKSAYTLIKRMKELLRSSEKLKPIQAYKWRAGAAVRVPRSVSTGVPGDRELAADGETPRYEYIGGHVHLEVPPRDFGGDYASHDLRLRALDRVTRYLEGLDILPLNESTTRRNNSEYGHFGAWRPAGESVDPNLGIRTARTEYRTPASWLYDPKAAFLALTGLKLACAAPQIALDVLKVRDRGFKNLLLFYETFKHRDSNAKRAVEKVLDKGLKSVQADPDVDIKSAWGVEEKNG